MSRIKSQIVRLGKQKIITGTIVDVLGDLCSVRLGGQGRDVRCRDPARRGYFSHPLANRF